MKVCGILYLKARGEIISKHHLISITNLTNVIDLKVFGHNTIKLLFMPSVMKGARINNILTWFLIFTKKFIFVIVKIIYSINLTLI